MPPVMPAGGQPSRTRSPPRPDRRGVGHHYDRLRLTAKGELGLVVGGPRALGGVRVHTLDVHDHDLAALDLAEEDLLRELVLDLALDRPAQRPGTQHGVEPAAREQRLRRRRQLDGHVLVGELRLHPRDHEVDHRDDLLLRQLVEHDDVVDAVQELRAEVLLQLVVDLGLHPLVVRLLVVALGEAEPHGLADVLRAEVRGEDDDGVLEVDRPALTVGQATVFQHLQEGVVDLLVRLLDLVEQDHRERLAPHLLRQLAALLVAHVPGRGTEEPRGGVAVVELAHVDLDERVVLAEQEVRQRLRQLGLTDTGRAGEDERTRRALGVLQTGTRTADRLRDGLDRLFLADDPLVQLVLHAEQTGGLLLGELEHRDAGPVREDLGDLLVVDLRDDVQVARLPLLLALRLLPEQLLLRVAQVRGPLEVLRVDRRLLVATHVRDLLVELAQVRRRRHPTDAHPGAGLVDQVDRLVRQEAVGDVAVSQRGRGHQRRVGDRDPVVRLVPVAQALEDLDGVRDARLAHLDRLEAAFQGRVLLDVLAVLVERGGTDRLQLAAGQHRLEDAGGVDRALGRTRTHEGVDLVDEQDDVAAGADLLEHLLQALFEVAAVPGARDQRSQVQRVELLVLESLGHLALDDALSQTLDNSGLADTGLPDQDRVVLGPPGEDLHDPLDLLLPTDDRIQLALTRLLGEVATELVEHQRRRRGALPPATGRPLNRVLAPGPRALVTRQQLQHLLAHPVEIGTQLHQHLRGDTLALTDQT